MLGFLQAYWPIIFACGTMMIICFLDPKDTWPPKLDMTGTQALRVVTNPWFLSMTIPLFLGLLLIRHQVQKASIPPVEHGSMVWFLSNILWFHTGCDIFSGYFARMPVLTELYALMSPAHLNPRWHESRGHLDGGYTLEAVVEVPLCAWALWLFWQRDPARHVVELFALSAQLAGTIVYYAPGLAKGESACWISYLDRSCGFIWIIYPLIMLRHHIAAARKPKAKDS